MGNRGASGSEVLWHGTCRSRFAIPTFAGFFLVGVVVAIVFNSFTGIVIALAGFCVLALVAITVEVTSDRLRVRYFGRLGWPSTSVKLGKVVKVESLDIDPKRYGGWGYRGSLLLFRRAALNLRRGPGLRLELADGRVFVVTVDDPDGAIAAMRPLLSISQS